METNDIVSIHTLQSSQSPLVMRLKLWWYRGILLIVTIGEQSACEAYSIVYIILYIYIQRERGSYTTISII